VGTGWTVYGFGWFRGIGRQWNGDFEEYLSFECYLESDHLSIEYSTWAVQSIGQ